MTTSNKFTSLKKLTVTGKSDGPHLLITAGVHGDEFEPMEAARRVFKQVQSIDYQLTGKLTVVPIVNKPAFELGSRTGPDQLDLARVCPGNRGGSITEQIASAVTALIRSCDFYIDMHCGGHLFDIWPFAGYLLHTDGDILKAQRELANSFLLPVVWGTPPDLSGRTLTIACDENIPAIYTEIGGGGTYREDYTKMAVEGCFNVLRHLRMIPEKPETPKVEYQLEDHRPGSGHLQSYLPSPGAGLYLPKVSVGQRVEKGEVIGSIHDELGESVIRIKADQSGIVLNLRNMPSVKKGDSLGLILPVN